MATFTKQTPCRQRRPIIGITTYPPRDDLNIGFSTARKYIEALHRCQAVPVLLPHISCDYIDDWLDTIDGIVMQGGGDINPERYGQKCEAQQVYGINDKRDEVEIALIKKVIARKIPALCICRGMQVLNVALGGTMYQDVDLYGPHIPHRYETQNSLHSVQIDPNSELFKIMGDHAMTVSWHHQAVHKLGSGLKAVAWAEDGIVEAIELEGSPHIVAVQWHPEKSADEDSQQQRLFNHLISIILNQKNSES